jgi:hypothetical protein
MAKRKRTNNDQQNTIKKTTKWATRPPFSIKKIESEQWWSTIQPISTIKEKLNFYECSIGFLELFRQCGNFVCLFVCLFVFVVVVGWIVDHHCSLSGRGYTVIPLSVCPSVLPSFRPRYFSSHFSQQLLMAEIWYLVTSVI